MEKELLISAFSRMHLKLVATARNLLGTGADVDDALQEAFCRLWAKRRSIRTDNDASGLVVTTVRNVCIDALRRRNVHPSLTGVDETMVQTDNDTDERDELLAEVTAVIDRTLSPRQRDILYKRDCGGWEIADLAQLHGLTEANVRLILSRARAAVREAYRNKQR